MRYIETESIRERLSKRLNANSKDDYEKGFVHGALSVLNYESVDVQPVVHSKWLDYHIVGDKNNYFECKNCHFVSDVDFRYCPHCGAKMDGEE